MSSSGSVMGAYEIDPAANQAPSLVLLNRRDLQILITGKSAISIPNFDMKNEQCRARYEAFMQRESEYQNEPVFRRASWGDLLSTFDAAIVFSRRGNVGRAVVLYAKFILQALLGINNGKTHPLLELTSREYEIEPRVKIAKDYLGDILNNRPGFYKNSSEKITKYQFNVQCLMRALNKAEAIMKSDKAAAFQKLISEYDYNVHVIFLALSCNRDYVSVTESDFYKDKMTEIYRVSDEEQRAALLMGVRIADLCPVVAENGAANVASADVKSVGVSVVINESRPLEYYSDEILERAKQDDLLSTFDAAVVFSRRKNVGRATVFFAKFILQALLEINNGKTHKFLRLTEFEVNRRMKIANEYLESILKNQPGFYQQPGEKVKKYLFNVSCLMKVLNKLKAIMEGKNAADFKQQILGYNPHVIFLALSCDGDCFSSAELDFYIDKIREIHFVSDEEKRTALMLSKMIADILPVVPEKAAAGAAADVKSAVSVRNATDARGAVLGSALGAVGFLARPDIRAQGMAVSRMMDRMTVDASIGACSLSSVTIASRLTVLREAKPEVRGRWLALSARYLLQTQDSKDAGIVERRAKIDAYIQGATRHEKFGEFSTNLLTVLEEIKKNEKDLATEIKNSPDAVIQGAFAAKGFDSTRYKKGIQQGMGLEPDHINKLFNEAMSTAVAEKLRVNLRDKPGVRR